jgi:hypothetical protein
MPSDFYFNYHWRHYETERAVLFSVEGNDVWIPKSLIQDEDGFAEKEDLDEYEG